MRTRASAELEAVRFELDLLIDQRSSGAWSDEDERRYLQLAAIEALFLGRREVDLA